MSSTSSGSGGSTNNDLAQAIRELLTYPVRTAPGTPAREREKRGAGDLKNTVEDAIGDVLGWRRTPGRIDGVLAALEQAFIPYEHDGRVLYRHQTNIASFHSELEGGVVGAQASLHVRATEALNRSLPLLERLEPLVENANIELAAARKSVIATEYRELVDELGRLGGPRIARIDHLWEVLLGENNTATDPDRIAGELGRLRNLLGLESGGATGRVNVAGEEQRLTDFRIIADDLTSLRTNWQRDRNSFDQAGTSAFLGIQLVGLERRLAVVAGSVEELRAALDAVLIDADERRTRRITVSDTGDSILLADLLEWIEDFATQEGPRLVKEGGRLAVAGPLHDAARKLRRLVEGAIKYRGPGLGRALNAPSVQEALRALENHLRDVAITSEEQLRHAEELKAEVRQDGGGGWSRIELFALSDSKFRTEPQDLTLGKVYLKVEVTGSKTTYPAGSFPNGFEQSVDRAGSYLITFDKSVAEKDPRSDSGAAGLEVY